ncbi:MAG TPA: hypothetical protein VL424_09390 [Pararobbsia sp.]|nr:hypothetical protein [Pararobbsia sp.]
MLIKRAALREAARNFDLVDDAHRHARAVITRAEREAEAIRHYAAARGSREGTRSAWQSITPWLDAFERRWIQTLAAFECEMRDALETAFHAPEIAELITRQVFDALAGSRLRRIRICIPPSMTGLRADFSTWAAQAGIEHVEVTGCDDDRLSIECGDDVFLFDPAACARELVSSLPAPAPGQTPSERTDESITDEASPPPLLCDCRAAVQAIDTNAIRRAEHAQRLQPAQGPSVSPILSFGSHST